MLNAADWVPFHNHLSFISFFRARKIKYFLEDISHSFPAQIQKKKKNKEERIQGAILARATAERERGERREERREALVTLTMSSSQEKAQKAAQAQTPAIVGIESPLKESPIYLGEEGTPLSGSLLEVTSPSLSSMSSSQRGGEKSSKGEDTVERMPTLKNLGERETDTKVVLEDFDFHSKQLREELDTFKNSLMTMGTPPEYAASATTESVPASMERVYKQPEINPLHSRRHLTAEEEGENETSSEHSSRPQSPKNVAALSDTSSVAPSLVSSPIKESRSYSFDRLGKILRHNGFALHFVGNDNSAKVNGILAAFYQVLNQYERRGKLIQEMLASNELSQRQEHRLEAKARKMRLERDEARRDLNMLSEKFEAKLSRSMDEKRNASEGRQKLGTEKVKMQSKLTHMEHIIRAREKEIDQLKNKLRDKVERDERRQKRDKVIYDKLRHKVSRQSSGSVSAIVRELRAVEIVGIYESQREVLESELVALRTDLHETKSRLADKERYILNKDMAGNWNTPAEGEILNSLAVSERAAADAVRNLAEIESKAAEAAKNAAKNLAEEQRKNEILAEENASLILELESRPQVKDLQAAQRQIEMLERKMSTIQIENKENLPQDVKNQMSKATSAKIRKDRKLFQLGLHKVQNLPHSVLVQIVQDACLKVELSDPTVLSQSLAKLLRIVAAVPRMERFVGAVCEVSLQDGINFIPKDIKNMPEPKDVPRILQHWLSELKKLHDLQLLHTGLVGELEHRSSATKAKGKTTVGIMSAVKEMIVAERAFHQMKATFDNASQIMKDNPEELLSKIVAHFQRLFSCKNLEGTFAAINQAYLALTESKNFLKALRNLIGLDRSAGINACLARVRQLVLLQAQKYATELEAGGNEEEGNETESVAASEPESEEQTAETESKIETQTEEELAKS